MRPIEVNSFIGRTQDVSPLKQAEDTKPMVQQHTLAQNMEKQIDNRMEQVVHKEDSEFESPLNENGRGQGQYEDRRQRKKNKEEEDGKVIVKTKANFDIRI